MDWPDDVFLFGSDIVQIGYFDPLDVEKLRSIKIKLSGVAKSHTVVPMID